MKNTRESVVQRIVYGPKSKPHILRENGRWIFLYREDVDAQKAEAAYRFCAARNAFGFIRTDSKRL